MAPELMDFSATRDQLENWWNFGEQNAPCIIAEVRAASAPPPPDTDDLTRFWTDVDFIIDRAMSRIDHAVYYGQAVPHHYVDFGSSAMAGVLGADMEYVDKETIWAYPVLESVEQVCDVSINEATTAFRVIFETTRRSAERARNHHYIAPFALEGMSDLLAALYGTESFMMDLVMSPDAVKRAMNHCKELWLAAFAHVQDEIARSGNDGGIGWAGIWAPGTTFPIQEDVAYMISPEMFGEFLMPHILDEIDAMDYPFFHLDGIGMIPHLDHLLGIEKLKVIQWQPGAGKEELAQWYDLIRRILEKKKSVQVFARAEEVDDLVAAVGPRGLLVTVTNATHESAARLEETYRIRL